MKSFAFAVALVLAVSCVEARAQWPLGTFGYGSYYAPGMYANDTRVPYFSLHPPVYYSYPVPRPYGYSPWAYPGWTETPHVPSAEPQTLVNPYFLDAPARAIEPKSPSDAPQQIPAKPSALNKQASAKKTHDVQPLRIQNPYFHGIAAGGAN